MYALHFNEGNQPKKLTQKIFENKSEIRRKGPDNVSMITDAEFQREVSYRKTNEELLLLLSSIARRYGKLLRWVFELLKSLFGWGATFGMQGPTLAKVEELLEKGIAEITELDDLIEEAFKAFRLRLKKRKEKAIAEKLKAGGLDK